MRALIRHVASCAARLGRTVSPLLCFHRQDGDVYRVMLRVDRQRGSSAEGDAASVMTTGCIGVCATCGSYAGPFETAAFLAMSPYGSPCCPGCGAGPGELRSWGPIWTGPLHDLAALEQLEAEGTTRGWLHCEERPPSTTNDCGIQAKATTATEDLQEVLPRLRLEAAAEKSALATGQPLLPWTLRIPDIARRARCRTPKLSAVLDALHSAGFVTCHSPLGPQQFRTNAPVPKVVEICRALATPG